MNYSSHEATVRHKRHGQHPVGTEHMYINALSIIYISQNPNKKVNWMRLIQNCGTFHHMGRTLKR